MKRNKVLCSLVILFWGVFPLVFAQQDSDVYYEAEIIAEIREKIFANYVDRVPSKKLLKGALRGMMSELDEYCEYLDEDMLKQVYENTQGEFVGIGIVLTLENSLLTVISPIEDSPAAQAGILAGDRILIIDGQSTENWTLEEATNKLRGSQGTTVKLSILHEGSREPKEVIIVRNTIQIHSVKDGQIVDEHNKIGYLRLIKFNRNTKEELVKNIHLLQQQGMKSLIIDLRFNPGGLMESSVEIINLFVSDGILVYLKGRTPDNYRVFRAEKSLAEFEEMPLVILINKRSASASEIVAGSLQDHKRAVLVGERSYGKGLVQTVLHLREEKTAIKLTTARYYIPSGNVIQKSKEKEGGILPNIVVPISDVEEKNLMEQFYQSKKRSVEDIQLQKAIQQLQQIQQK